MVASSEDGWLFVVQVEPEKLSVPVRDKIRTELLDEVMLQHLEGCGSINWESSVVWQLCQLGKGVASSTDGTEAWVDAGILKDILEVSVWQYRGYYVCV